MIWNLAYPDTAHSECAGERRSNRHAASNPMAGVTRSTLAGILFSYKRLGIPNVRRCVVIRFQDS